MADWLTSERDRLRRYDTRALLIANAVILGVQLGVLIAAYLLASAAGMPTGTTAIALLLLLLVMAPLVPLILMDWLRTRLWLWWAGDGLRRLQSQRFLSHYVELIGERKLTDVHGAVRQRVEAVLEAEREGVRVSVKDYARALQAVLHADPSLPAPGAGPAGRRPIRRGVRRRR